MSQHARQISPSNPIPLRAWKVQNFKSIREAELAFAPLTILVGANSSGKTSLIQSILLVVQAAQGGNQGSTFPLNGPLVSVGNFDEARFAHSKAAIRAGGAIELPFDPLTYQGRPSRTERSRLAPPTSASLRSHIEWSIAFDSPAVNEPGSADIAAVELEVKHGDGVDAQEHVTLASSRRGQGQIEADVERFRVGSLALPVRGEFALGYVGEVSAGETDRLPVRGLQLKAGLPHNVITTWRLGDAAASVWAENRIVRPSWATSRGVGIDPRGLVSTRPSPEVRDEALESWVAIAVEEIGEWDRQRVAEPISLPAFLARSRRPLPPDERLALRDRIDELVEMIRQRLDMNEEVFLPPERQLAGWLNDVMSDVFSFFQKRVLYLGPLRQDPQVVYKTAPVDTAGFIGTKGEYLATVLHAFRAREVLSFREDGEPEPMPLAEALNAWAARLDLADAIQTRDLGRLGIQVSVQRGGIPAVDLTSVGVGVSQLLPVIVACLLTRPGSLILLEQPELHLHPGLQQKLGDFLLACARSGRQLIVETHSEYLVSRLRRWIAEDDSGDLLNAVAVYFVEQREDASQFRRVGVNELGGVDNWPAGFFDQAASESRKILEAGLSKRGRRAVQAGADVPAQ